MSDTNTEESALPAYRSDHHGKAANTCFEPVGGLSLRDYFAGQALAGLALIIQEYQADQLASDAYSLADAMMKIRELNKPNH